LVQPCISFTLKLSVGELTVTFFWTLQVGMIAMVISDSNHPNFSVYWLCDACLVYHLWLSKLNVFEDQSLRPQLDDATHILTRAQKGISLTGSTFTSGIKQAVFDLKLNKPLGPKACIGPPAVGT
jgi:glucoamylase